MTDEEIVKDLTELSLYTGFQEKYVQALNAALDLIIHQKSEIEELEKVLNGRDQLVNALNKCYNQAKSEAIKEFAERLKEKISDCHIVGAGEYCGFDCGDIHECVNNILKEIVGEDNA